MERVLRLLYRGPRGDAASVVNPYRHQDPSLDARGGWRRRRQNLERYLRLVGAPALLLVGEAPGYRGARFSGIAFTSERQLAGPPRARLAWAEQGFQASSLRPDLWQEPSSTIVWGALGGAPQRVLLWNAFPWHPQGLQGPLSNRSPESTLLCANLHVLEALLRACGGAPVAAIGRTAEIALTALGVGGVVALRHPARGGATLFRRQWRSLASELGLGGAPC
jgi:uracil-DNA glycosylase